MRVLIARARIPNPRIGGQSSVAPGEEFLHSGSRIRELAMIADKKERGSCKHHRSPVPTPCGPTNTRIPRVISRSGVINGEGAPFNHRFYILTRGGGPPEAVGESWGPWPRESKGKRRGVVEGLEGKAR